MSTGGFRLKKVCGARKITILCEINKLLTKLFCPLLAGVSFLCGNTLTLIIAFIFEITSGNNLGKEIAVRYELSHS